MLVIQEERVITLYEICKVMGKDHSKSKSKAEEIQGKPDFGTVAKMATVYNDKGQTIETYTNTQNKQQPMYEMNRDGEVFANSLDVAEVFEKRHANDVLRIIRAMTPRGLRNFTESSYTNTQNKQQLMSSMPSEQCHQEVALILRPPLIQINLTDRNQCTK